MAVTSRDLREAIVRELPHVVLVQDVIVFRRHPLVAVTSYLVTGFLTLIAVYVLLGSLVAAIGGFSSTIVSSLLLFIYVPLTICIGIGLAFIITLVLTIRRIRGEAKILKRIEEELAPGIEEKAEGGFWKAVDDSFSAIISQRD